MAARPGFSFGDFAARLAFGVALVLATFNPSGVNFVAWAMRQGATQTPLVALAGVTLLIVWAIYLRATLRAIGVAGVILAGAFVAALLWTLSWAGALDLSGGTALAWSGLVGLGVVLGIGLSWSHIRRGLSGQSDVDDVDA